jgi:peptidoglycan hydrolase-like protein with peptidoglycan-binding domain
MPVHVRIRKYQTNQRGFSHHILLPMIAIFIVASIGGYLTLKSRAAISCPPGTKYSVMDMGHGVKIETCKGPVYKGMATSYDCLWGKYPVKKVGEVYICKVAPVLKCYPGQEAYWVRYTEIGEYGYSCANVNGNSNTYANLHDKAYGCSYPRSTVKTGSKGNCVRYLQYALNHYAYETGSPKLKTDGTFGPLTEAAVRSFQKRFKKTVDGVAGPETWGGIDYLVNKYPDEHARAYGCVWQAKFQLPTLNKIGQKDKCVAYLQWVLTQDGFPVLPSGTFDEATKSAVKKFEAKHALTVNGGVGTDTWPTVLRVSAHFIGL